MSWYLPVFEHVAVSAARSLAILVVGTLAVLACRQPARRIRVIELTLLGCLIVPLAHRVPGAPRWSLPDWATRPMPSVAARSIELTSPVKYFAPVPPPPPPTELPSSQPKPTPVKSAPWTLPKKVFDPRLWIVAAYSTGVVVMAAWWGVGIWGLWRLPRSSRLADDNCRRILSEIAGSPSRRVKLLITSRAAQPFAFSWRHPVIVIPESVAQGDRRTLAWCLAHEWRTLPIIIREAWSLAQAVRPSFSFTSLWRGGCAGTSGCARISLPTAARRVMSPLWMITLSFSLSALPALPEVPSEWGWGLAGGAPICTAAS